MYIDTMFPDELDNYISHNSQTQTGPVAVVPIGSVEQHGPHLLLGTDGFIAGAMAAMTAEKLNAVLFPMIPFSWIGGLRPYAGTIDMRPLITGEYMEQIGLSILRQGFEKLVLVNSHGGGREMVYSVARRLFKKTGKQVITEYPSMFFDSWPELLDIVKAHGHENDWGIYEGSNLVAALRYFNENAIADQVLQNNKEAYAEFGEGVKIPEQPGMNPVMRLGDVGHDYNHECMHVQPKKALDPALGAILLDFMADKLAWGVKNA